MAKLQRKGVLAGTFGQQAEEPAPAGSGGIAVATAPAESPAPAEEETTRAATAIVPAQAAPPGEPEAAVTGAPLIPEDSDGPALTDEDAQPAPSVSAAVADAAEPHADHPEPPEDATGHNASANGAGVAMASAPDTDTATPRSAPSTAPAAKKAPAKKAAKAAPTRKTVQATHATPVDGDPEAAREAVERSWKSVRRTPENWTAVGVRYADFVKARLEQRRALDVEALGIPFAETHYTNVALASIPDDLDEAMEWVSQFHDLLDEQGIAMPQSTGTTSRVEKTTRAHMDRISVQMRAHKRYGLIGTLQSAAMMRLLDLLDASQEAAA